MKSPIFVHSLWRSGSTYVFDVFRRADGYWCYQEPIHEFVLSNVENPETLLEIAGEATKSLHHPELSLPYFYELHAIYPAWKNVITKKIIYDEYFVSECSNELIRYLKALIENAKGTPVIQECRTSSRISAIKDAVGGRHIYLWRNPWDQWWSFKIDNYFDKALLMVLNAEHPPIIIQQLLKEIDIFPFHDENINKEFEYFDIVRLNPEQSYSVFYAIWFLGILEGIRHADTCINIDELSQSNDYKSEILTLLISLGIDALDFSDCHVYQSFFSAEEQLFFINIENDLHIRMLSSGISEIEIEEVLKFRQLYKPNMNERTIKEDLKRTRNIVFRTATECSDRLKPIRQMMYAKHLLFENATLRCYSKRGFHGIESWGVWSSGKNAVLGIAFKDKLSSSVHIYVQFGIKIFDPLAKKSPVVKITYGKNQVSYVLLRENKKYIEAVELNFLCDGQSFEIFFECTDEDSPVNHGSADSRNLSFGIDKFSAEIIESQKSTLISEETLFLGIQ